MRHNKNADVFLIYSNLVRLVSKSIVFESTRNKRDASIAKTIIKKHFDSGMLREYIESAHVINNGKLDTSDQHIAESMLSEIHNYIKSKVTLSQYRIEKKNFINEVKKFGDLDILLSTPFDNYKSIVSTHLFLEDCMVDSSPRNVENRTRIRTYLISELTTPKTSPAPSEDVQEFIRLNNIDDLMIEMAHVQLKENMKSVSNEKVRNLLEAFVYHTNTDNYIKWLKSELISELNITKSYQKKLSLDHAKSISEVVKEIQEVSKQITYENYEDVTHKLLSIIELNDVLEHEKGEQ